MEEYLNLSDTRRTFNDRFLKTYVKSNLFLPLKGRDSDPEPLSVWELFASEASY